MIPPKDAKAAYEMALDAVMSPYWTDGVGCAQRAIAEGRPIADRWKPGAVIMRLPKEVREKLKDLKSSDVANYRPLF